MKNHFIKSAAGGYWNGIDFSGTRETAAMMGRQAALAFINTRSGCSAYRVSQKKKAPTVTTDGGLAESGIVDRNNCTVRALAIAANVPYKFADEIATKAGRKRNKGMHTFKLMQHASISGIKSQSSGLGRSITVARFLQLNPQGRFVCRISKHAFAVVDGVIHDQSRAIGERCRITQYWAMLTYGMPIQMPTGI